MKTCMMNPLWLHSRIFMTALFAASALKHPPTNARRLRHPTFSISHCYRSLSLFCLCVLCVAVLCAVLCIHQLRWRSRRLRMKVGDFEVQLRRADDHCIYTERCIGDNVYVQATPGGRYCVKVIVSRKGKCWPAERIRIALYVDGVDVNYWKRLDLRSAAAQDVDFVASTFFGFKAGGFFTFHTLSNNYIEKVSGRDLVCEKRQAYGSIRVEIFAAEILGDAETSTVDSRKTRKSDALQRWKNRDDKRPLCVFHVNYRSPWILDKMSEIVGSSHRKRAAVSAPTSSQSMDSSSKKHQRVEVDLTGDDERPVVDAVIGSQCPHSSTNEVDSGGGNEDDEEDVVEVAPPPREVQMLDLSDDSDAGPLWRTTSIPRT